MSYLRSLETEFGESTNSIRVELNKLEHAGLLDSTNKGNKKMFYANTSHPLFTDINSILRKFIGIDQIVEKVTSQIGDLQSAYLTGDLAVGRDSQIIDLALVGNQLDRKYIDTLIEAAEKLISRRIKYIVLTREELIKFFNNAPILLIWSADGLTKQLNNKEIQ
jgi:hypothetical protein